MTRQLTTIARLRSGEWLRFQMGRSRHENLHAEVGTRVETSGRAPKLKHASAPKKTRVPLLLARPPLGVSAPSQVVVPGEIFPLIDVA